MKARVKATGEIVELSNCSTIVDTKQRLFTVSELEDISDKTDKVLLDELDEVYWANMEHQYAGMAMQGLSEKYFKEYRDYCAGFGDMDEDEAKGAMKDFANAMADVCYYFAHALVEKMKEADR